MPPNQTAQRNHDELFPNHVSTLAVTDPELIEVFDNFAFDEVLKDSKLDKKTRLMVQLAAIIASQAIREYRAMLGAALTIGVTPVEAKEVLYQAVPYVGIAKVFDFLHVTNEVLTERGVQLPLPGQATTHCRTFVPRAAGASSKSRPTAARSHSLEIPFTARASGALKAFVSQSHRKWRLSRLG
jgi:alkylhydroperoxidase/carboxymuconolactone decarboxylase family protein YurZ